MRPNKPSNLLAAAAVILAACSQGDARSEKVSKSSQVAVVQNSRNLFEEALDKLKKEHAEFRQRYLKSGEPNDSVTEKAALVAVRDHLTRKWTDIDGILCSDTDEIDEDLGGPVVLCHGGNDPIYDGPDTNPAILDHYVIFDKAAKVNEVEEVLFELRDY